MLSAVSSFIVFDLNCEITMDDIAVVFFGFLFLLCKLLSILKLLEQNVNIPLSVVHNILTDVKLVRYQLNMHYDYKTVNIISL